MESLTSIRFKGSDSVFPRAPSVMIWLSDNVGMPFDDVVGFIA